MAKGLKPTTNPSGFGKELKQARTGAANPPSELVRPILPIDVNNIPNQEPLIGRKNPTHINFLFEFGKQSYRGTVPYGPLGSTHDTYAEGRNIIKALGSKS
jgi:hypothetical protein